MKAKKSLILVVTLAAMLSGQMALSLQVPANASSQEDVTPRGLYISKKADAMRVQVLDTRTGAAVSPSQEFKKDDKLKLVVESNFKGYVYIVNVEAAKAGETRFLLYPNPNARDNAVKASQPLELSANFDEKPAIESLQVIVSHDRIEYLDSALKGDCSTSENRCKLDAQTSARVASLIGDRKASTKAEGGGVFARASDQKQDGLRSRDIILSSGKEDANATYVAIPVAAGSEARLKAKEVFVFEICLKHV